MELEIEQIRNNDKHHIIVCIDANETTRKKGNPKIKEFVRKTGLVDSHQFHHQELDETPTHADGSSQIDYCLVSTDILRQVRKCGITAMHYAVQGADHRSIWLDIDVTTVLGGKQKAPGSIPTRGLKLKNITALKKFKEHLIEYSKQHRMDGKIRKISIGLMDSNNLEGQEKIMTIKRWAVKLEKWDKLMIDLMLAAERKVSRRGLTKTYL